MSASRHDDDRILLVQPRQYPDDEGVMALRHTLNRHVPDMARGFTIQTSYGELRIESGRLAERISDLVTVHTLLEIERLEKAAGAQT